MQTAIVTGASSGIGRDTALFLARKGFRVVACARRHNLLEQLASELGEPHQTRVLDVTDRAAVNGTVSELVRNFGSIDLLFNNAGVNAPGSCGIEPDVFDSIIQTNLVGAWNMLNAVVPQMKRQRSGTIINMSSICGKIAFSEAGAYSASKFGVIALNESLFRELVPLGIRVTALCPSWVDTDMAHHSPVPDEGKIQTLDICRTIDYLLSLSPNAHVRELVIECSGDLT